MASTTNPKDRCPRCGQNALVTDADTGGLFCEKCGHVITDNNLRQAFGELDRLKYRLTVGDAVIANAAYICRNAFKKDLARGRSISALAASALYAACRNIETPRTLKEMEQASNIPRKDIARCYRLLLRELNLKVP